MAKKTTTETKEIVFKQPQLAQLEHKQNKGKPIMYMPIEGIFGSIEEACGHRSRSITDFTLNIDRDKPVGKNKDGFLIFLWEAEAKININLPDGTTFSQVGQALGSTPSTILASDDAARTLMKKAKAAVFKDAIRSLSPAFRIGSEEVDDKTVTSNEAAVDLIIDDMFDEPKKKEVTVEKQVVAEKQAVVEKPYVSILPEFHKVLDPKDPEYNKKFVGVAGKFLQERGCAENSPERKELLAVYDKIKGIQ